MGTIKQAIQWLREGKKVTRPCWVEDSYWIIGADEKLCWSDKQTAHIHLNQLEANDFEIYNDIKKRISAINIFSYKLKKIQELLDKAYDEFMKEILK